MIEIRKGDLGKDVTVTYAHNERGTIAYYDHEYVYVKLKNECRPKAFKRRYLTWTRDIVAQERKAAGIRPPLNDHYLASF